MAAHKNYIIRNAIFLLFCALFITVSLYYVYAAPKGAAVLYLNGIATPELDGLFVLISHSGLGISLVLASLLLVFRKIKYTAAALTALAFTGILTFILKQLVFSGTLRPVCFFDSLNLHIIEHYDYSCLYSFPSGHTMSAFAFACVASAISRSTAVQILLFAYAALVGIARMYLLQHFLEDVAAGAVLGILCGHIALWLWSGTTKSWIRKPIQQLIPTLGRHAHHSLV